MAARSSFEQVITDAAADISHSYGSSTASEGAADVPEKNGELRDEENSPDGELSRTASVVSFDQYIGVSKIESLYMVFGRGWRLVLLWVSVALIGYVWSLAAITTGIYSPFATSFFGRHTVVGTMGVVNNIMAAAGLPILSKICDVFSRPTGLLVATVLFTVGYIVVAGSPTVFAVAAGEAIFTAGRTGIYQIMHILISDMTQLRWRGLIIACYSLPWIMNGFLAGEITANIRALSTETEAWRWGYGMFAIIIPVAIAPSILILYWGNVRAKKLGALSLASGSQARRQVIEAEGGRARKSFLQHVLDFWSQVNGFGLLLFTAGLALILTPPTLEQLVDGGYSNHKLIIMYVIGAVSFISFLVWDCFFAKHPIWPRRLMNRVFILCVTIDALHFFSTGLTDAYYNSWAYILHPNWTTREYTYFGNIHNVGLCFFAVCTGALMYWTKRYRWIQIAGLVIRTIGEGINYYATINQREVVFIMAKILISCGAGMIVTTTAVAAPASAPHKDLAGSMAVLHMVSQVTGSIGGSIGANVWNKRVPANLRKYLPNESEKEINRIFGSIGAARRKLPHEPVYRAYSEGIAPLLAAAIGTTALALILACFTPEMGLTRSHNFVEKHKIVRMRNKDEVTDDAVRAQVEKAEDRARRQLASKCPVAAACPVIGAEQRELRQQEREQEKAEGPISNL